MPRIPKSEAEQIVLAQQIEDGLTNNPKLADSPITKTAFSSALKDFTGIRNEILVDETALKGKHDIKDGLQDTLIDMMERVIDFTEVITDKNPDDMASIGIIINTERVKAAPGQPRYLEIISQINALLGLDWKNPSDGGRVVSYRVLRRERPAGDWEVCGATDKTEIVLTNQPRGIELEYCVVAYNANGDSVQSNIVSVVL